MTIRTFVALGLAATALSACATTMQLPPTQVIRYHLDNEVARGTVAVRAMPDGDASSLEFKSYADAVQAELVRAGYTVAAPGTDPQFIAVVGVSRSTQVGPPKRSAFSVGLGGGGFTGGGGGYGRRGGGGGGVGLGGGVSFPIGGGGRSSILISELAVTIKRLDLSPVWEGRAHGFADEAKANAVPGGQPARLAHALFLGFPGQSGRTIEVK